MVDALCKAWLSPADGPSTLRYYGSEETGEASLIPDSLILATPEGPDMKKFIVPAFTSLDDVVQARVSPEEDPSASSARSGWIVPCADGSET